MPNVTLKQCISLSDDCKYLRITENTGIYDAVNTGGWGSPNHDISTASSATVTISKRNSDGTLTPSPNSPINVFPVLPSDISGYTVISAETAGYGAGSTYSDGIYLITYTVSGDDPGAYSLTTSQYKGFICAGTCCYKQLANKASLCVCDCEGLNKKLISLMRNIRLFNSASDCADLIQMQAYIDKITKLCTSCNGCGDSGSSC